jgi:hypothetical protein
MAALGISESEYILATGAQNLKWPDRQPDELTTLRAKVAELEAGQQWVAVEDGLPEKRDGLRRTRCLLVYCAERKNTYTATYDYETGGWYYFGGDGYDLIHQNVTHWMPLPSPPTEDKSDD